MPPLTIKRTEPLVKAVRRGATRQLDAAIAALTETKHPRPDLARRELLRLRATLHLFRRPLTAEVFGRENRLVTRCLKQLPGQDATLETLDRLAATAPALDVAELRETLAAETRPPARKRKNAGPDPKQLRLVADLAEMRMRARYWHLPEGGFELLAPGLRQTYARAARLSREFTSNSEQATAKLPGDELADTLGRLARQLQSLERACPVLLEPYRKALRTVERDTRQRAELAALRPHVLNHDALLARLDHEHEKLVGGVDPLLAQLFIETAPAFLKRLQGYWNAWRG